MTRFSFLGELHHSADTDFFHFRRQQIPLVLMHTASWQYSDLHFNCF